MRDADLNRVERSVFRAAADTGLWDVLIASFVAQWAVAPLLSRALGDFWSSAVFVPVWVAVYVVLRAVQSRVVAPRIGVVRLGAARRRRLGRFGVGMAVVCVLALAAGIVAALRSSSLGLLRLVPVVVVLLGSATAAYVLATPRYFVYGVLFAAAPFAGEWLFRRGYVSNHGYPAAFGFIAAVIFIVGIARLSWRLARTRPCDGVAAREQGHE